MITFESRDLVAGASILLPLVLPILVFETPNRLTATTTDRHRKTPCRTTDARTLPRANRPAREGAPHGHAPKPQGRVSVGALGAHPPYFWAGADVRTRHKAK